MNCPLCQSTHGNEFYADKFRRFIQCCNCSLIYVPEQYHVTVDEEKRRYALHKNSSGDEEYFAYLRIVSQQLKRIPIDRPVVLDFGCGEHAVLTKILQSESIDCTPYDPLYGIGLSAVHDIQHFDIVVACEVVEHCRALQKDILLMCKLLKPHGYVYLRTELFNEASCFGTWWYAKDCTHINFFTPKAMKTLAERLELEIYYTDEKSSIILG